MLSSSAGFAAVLLPSHVNRGRTDLKRCPRRPRSGRRAFYDRPPARTRAASTPFAERGERYVGYSFPSCEPDAAECPTYAAEKQFWPEGANVRRAEEFLAGTLDRHKKENTLPFAHWSLSILSVHPDLQGQGVGRRLIQDVLDAAKRDGVPVTLESTECGRPLYERMGFVDFGEILQGKEDPEVEPMVHTHSSQ